MDRCERCEPVWAQRSWSKRLAGSTDAEPCRASTWEIRPCSAGRFSTVKYSLHRVGTANRASGSLALPIRTRGMHWVERGSQLACAALIASHAPICALAHEPRESPAIIFHGNGSAGATGRRCRYKLAASGGSAGCVRQLQAPIWVTPIAGGYETAKNRGIFATSAHRAL